MANEEHLKTLLLGATPWNRWRKENPNIKPDLSTADLQMSDLSSANLSMADFTCARLNGANLKGATLDFANLTGTTFNGANLRGAQPCRSKLTEATFTSADLRNANIHSAVLIVTSFDDCVLDKADLSGATVGSCVFADLDLSTAIGLHTIEHLRPSTIGIDTLYRSKGLIPDAFLRGAGLPDEVIALARSLAERPVEFNSCFISYSTKDQDFAHRLYNDLQNNGVRCWFSPHDVKSGQKLHEQIDQAIRLHDRLLLILSPHSINSPWVKTEIAKARKREAEEHRHVLFPIRLVDFETLRKWECFDADTGTDSAKEIREYFIPDFTNWKNGDSYRGALNRLLQDLKSKRTKAALATK